jgi:hypothetical protein
MRHRVRIQPYLSPEVHQKLRDYASSHHVTESGVAEEALVQYLGREQAEAALVVRRLDALTQSVKGVQREQEVLAQAVVHVAKLLFRIAAGSAPDAKAQAERRYEKLVAKVAEELKAGLSLTGDVRRAGLFAAPPTPPTAAPRAPQKGR